MNELPRWEIAITREDAIGDLEAATGSSTTLILSDEAEGSSRRIALVIVEIAYEGREGAGYRYSITLGPPEWCLMLRSGYRIFLEKSVPQIAVQVLHDAGIPADRLVLRLAGDYLLRRQCTQYAERDWAFLERLLADEGISYWFDTVDGTGTVLVLGDSSGSHDGIATPVTVPYHDESGLNRVRSFSSFELTEEVSSTRAELRDFDPRNPDVYLDAGAGEGDLSYFEYPSFVPTSAGAKRRAQVRLEQLQRLKVRATAGGDCIRLQPGRIVAVDGCSDDEMNRRYVVTSVEHEYHRASPGAQGHQYKNSVSLVPHGETFFRPALPGGAPRIEGLESAMTTGPPGEEIHVDDLGRVKLRFLWDPSGITDDRSSAWVRCLQWALGGSMLLPRVGWEVSVAYMNGNPDHPFVLGRLYNATAVVPYSLPGASATTALKSVTSPGGGGVNEIRMADDGGKQELYIHASKDQSVSVGGTSKTDVGADQTHDVGLMFANVVLASQTHTVGGMQSINIGTDFTTAVKGAASLAVGGVEILNATANRMVSAKGAYTEIVGGSYALQSNQSNVQVGGKYLQVNGGGAALNAGIGITESVAGARGEVVSGSYSVIASGKYSDTTYGAKRIQAGGAADETAGGPVATAARIGKVKAATATLAGGGGFAISGAHITIEAGSLIAGALEIAGGALKATSGTTKVDASTVKRPAGAKLE